jgi:hypothetical protein
VFDRLPAVTAGFAGKRKGVSMHRPGEGEDAGKRPEMREKLAHVGYSASPLARDPPPPFETYEGAALARARSSRPGVSPWLFVMATALNTTVASVLAVIITLGVVNQDRSNADAQEVAPATFQVAATRREPPPASAFQPISLRPIGSPDQPLRLEPQRPGRFPLQLQPDEGVDEPFILALSGAPAGTIVSGANRISSDAWFLSPGSASRLEIVLPEWSTSVFEIAVALRRTNGMVAAQTTAWIAVPPPPGVLPAPPPSEAAGKDQIKGLLVQADRLIGRGDIVGARALYQRATELGSAPAALALGTTYDPNRLWSLGVLGLAGNKERARQWYLRASELGSADAKARLTALGF